MTAVWPVRDSRGDQQDETSVAHRGDTPRTMPEESTTSDLVERLRLFFAAASRRDLDTLTTFYASDAVLDLSDLGLATYDGLDAIRAFVEDWFRSYAEYEVSADEILR